ncbi:glycoside hydrolase family 5 protein [Patescibacteria group bacterium]|nr:glycoside hydrolase family 5 protein [Patescibacteria group bacterium]
MKTKTSQKKKLNFPIYRVLIGVAFYLFILTFIDSSQVPITPQITIAEPLSFITIRNNNFYNNDNVFIPKGINHFDMYSLWDPNITNPSFDWITPNDFLTFKKAGFNSIRIAVKTDYFWDNENNQLKESGFIWLDYINSLALKNDLRLIIDMHMPTGGAQQDYNPNDQNKIFWENTDYKITFINVWREIAKRNSNNSTIWAYDIMNEPATWDLTDYENLIFQTTAAIRSVDSNHIVIIQPGLQLQDGEVRLIFPKVYDSKIAHSLHFYEPHAFTHQNVSWGISGDQAIINYPTTTSTNDYWNEQKISKAFTQAAYNAGLEHYPLILTEFGTVFHKIYTGQDQWIDDVIKSANKLNTGWHYWYYKGPAYNEQMAITTQNGLNRPIVWKVLKQQAQNGHE